jgi:nucleotide-binding universal stress UspA family protein
MEKTIIVPIDLSDATNTILEHAVNLASSINGKIILISVVGMYVDYFHTDMSLLPAQWDEIYESQKKHIEAELHKLASKYPHITIEIQIMVGNPKVDIVNLAQNNKADYIVMGTHGRTGLSHIMIGSTAEYVLRHAKVPILVVPIS